MSTTTSGSASFANPTPGEEGSLMSRSTEIASDFGRRLRIADGEMPVQTRSQLKSEAQHLRQQASQPTQRGSGRGSNQLKAVAGPSRQARARKEASPEDDSDDDDDDDGEDDDDDGSDGGDGGPPQQRLAPDHRVLQQAMAFEPNNLTYDEVVGTLPGVTVPGESETFRNFMLALGSQGGNGPARQRIETTLPLGGEVWWTQVAKRLTNRRMMIISRYDNDNGTDSIRTCHDIKQFFSAVEGVLRRGRPSPTLRSTIVDLLITTFWDITLRDEDKTTTNAALPHYAGGHYEYNLYYHFACHKHWFHCLEVIRRLGGSGYLAELRARRDVWVAIHGAISQKRAENDEAREFAPTLGRYLSGLGIQAA